MDNHKYRFDVISTISGRQESYIGIFNNKDQALSWYGVYGRWHKRMGRPLILVKCETRNTEAEAEEEFEDEYEQVED